MQNPVVKTDRKTLGKWGEQFLFVLMRILFGVGWVLAGITKILGGGGSSGHSWFVQPGVFLTDYLMKVLEKPNVPDFYKIFIEDTALNQVMFLNYAIPVTQVVVGLFLITGFLTLPSVLICLFMHINFILSGNINLMSLILYTTAFSILLSGRRIYVLSLDQYLKLDNVFYLKKEKLKVVPVHSTETFSREDLKKLLQEGIIEIANSINQAQASQDERIEQLIAYLEKKHMNENNLFEHQNKVKQAVY
ncbi:DoxX protein [Paenibacillus tianmuensis]|uniref:DoxX protein n=1 Tax=Paenibacillus tianmuensis TaxID=624147 RepID=A0A1G4U1U9_9BACL|nr:DoxX family membrane protein [Paenibacillus tianmuensis]SCW86809.1 DoxX protein [Paenibacillus tianmuensis]